MMSPKTHCDDLDRLAREGELGSEMFAALAECMADDVRRFAQARCGNIKGDVDDISQDALLAAQRYLSSFRGEASLRTWLYRLVLSACSRHRRGRKNDPKLHASFDESPLKEAPGEADPEVSVMMEEKLAALQRAIERLRDKDRQMLQAVEWQGQSLAEVAESFDLSVSAVKSRMFRIRQQLRENLMAKFEDGEG